MYVCAPCARLVPMNIRKDGQISELELRTVASYYVSAGNQTRVFCKSQLSQLFSPGTRSCSLKVRVCVGESRPHVSYFATVCLLMLTKCHAGATHPGHIFSIIGANDFLWVLRSLVRCRNLWEAPPRLGFSVFQAEQIACEMRQPGNGKPSFPSLWELS